MRTAGDKFHENNQENWSRDWNLTKTSGWNRIRTRLSELDDGTVVYKVRFTVDGQRYSYRINAVDGSVVEMSTAEANH